PVGGEQQRQRLGSGTDGDSERVAGGEPAVVEGGGVSGGELGDVVARGEHARPTAGAGGEQGWLIAVAAQRRGEFVEHHRGSGVRPPLPRSRYQYAVRRSP